MSAPSWCWIRIETSGVNRCRDPSRCDLNVTPSSSTTRQPVLARRDHVVGPHAVDVHRQHLLEPGAERQHLEATGVGERRARPVHEGAESACRVDDVGPRLQVQVIGVGQHRLRAEGRHRSRAAPTSPWPWCRRRRTPASRRRRAASSSCRPGHLVRAVRRPTSNENPVTPTPAAERRWRTCRSGSYLVTRSRKAGSISKRAATSRGVSAESLPQCGRGSNGASAPSTRGSSAVTSAG